MSSNVWAKNSKAFDKVEAHVVLDNDGALIARIQFKNSGTRVTCFLHVIGTTMVEGWANGFGYCKTDAAFQTACQKLRPNGIPADRHIGNFQKYPDDGRNFNSFLRDLGYNVIRAV